MKNANPTQRRRRRRLLLWPGSILLVILIAFLCVVCFVDFRTTETRVELDINSGRLRTRTRKNGRLVKEELRETDFSRVAREFDLVTSPAEWKLAWEGRTSLWMKSRGGTHYMNIVHDADLLMRAIHISELARTPLAEDEKRKVFQKFFEHMRSGDKHAVEALVFEVADRLERARARPASSSTPPGTR